MTATVKELISGIQIADAEARGKVRTLLSGAVGVADKAARLPKQIGATDFFDALRHKSGVGLRRALNRAGEFAAGQVPGLVCWDTPKVSERQATLSGGYLLARRNMFMYPAWISEAEPLVLAVNYLRIQREQPRGVFVYDGQGAIVFCIHALERLVTRRRDLSIDEIRRGLVEAAADARLILLGAPDGRVEYSEIDVPAFGGCFRGFVRSGADVSLGMRASAWVDVRTFFDARLLDEADATRLEEARTAIDGITRTVPRSAEPVIDGREFHRLDVPSIRALFRPATRHDWIQAVGAAHGKGHGTA